MINLQEFERHLRQHGCVVVRQGAGTQSGGTQPPAHPPLFPVIESPEDNGPGHMYAVGYPAIPLTAVHHARPHCGPGNDESAADVGPTTL